MKTALMQVRRLGKRFGGLMAVNDLSFEVFPGELLSIIGPNGAGKTTLFNLLTGICMPTSGSVSVKGRDITGCKPYEAARVGMARTFQKTTVFREHSALDNVIIGKMLHAKAGVLGAILRTPSYKRKEARAVEEAREVLSFVGLAHHENTRVEELTEEARKRLSIAIALAIDPCLLLLDEPTGGVNMEEIGHLTDLIQKVQKSGVTICLIEHKMRMVMRISDRIIVLNHGRKLAEGTPKEVSNHEGVIQAYLGGRHAP